MEHAWQEMSIENLGWQALAIERHHPTPARAGFVSEVDALLFRLIERFRSEVEIGSPVARHIDTFRTPELERLKDATAAVLVGHRYGVAGLKALVDDRTGPLCRRYQAFLTLAELHPEGSWTFFRRYLSLRRHHAFVAAAAEACRFYPQEEPTQILVGLFLQAIEQPNLRAFLSPRILQSLFCLGRDESLPLMQMLTVVGHTHPDVRRCEVLRSLATIRVITGEMSESAKFPAIDADVEGRVEEAIKVYESDRGSLEPAELL